MLIIWFIFVVFSVSVNSQNKNFRLDLTLLSKRIFANQFEYICAAGDNVKDSAIILNTNWKDNNNPKSIYRQADGNKYEYNTNYDCDFQNDCTYNWLQRNELHKIVDSGNSTFQFLAPVLDKRWETFDVHFIKPNNPLNIELNPNKSLSFSLKSRNVSNLLLYNRNNPQNFYYIKLTPNIIVSKCENNNIKNTVLRNCVQIQEKQIKIDLKMWQHFTVNIDNTITIFNYMHENENELIKIENTLNIEITNLQIVQDDKIHNSAYCKIHKYKYLSLKNSNNNYYIGDQFKTDKDNSAICVEFYAITCKNCRIEFSINANIKKVISGNPEQKLHSWQYVRLFGEFISNGISNKLKVTNKKFEEPEFLAIDDIRLCHEKEYRIILLNSSNETDVSCQSLKHPTFVASKKITNNTYESSKICEDKTKIGNDCNIPCQAVTNEENCKQYTICKSSDKKSSSCSCAFGYEGTYCENNITFPYLRDSLVLVQSTINSVTVRLGSVNIDEKRNFKIEHFGIEYKEKKQEKFASNPWISTGEKYLLSTNNNITIHNLKPNVTYKVRAILYTADDTFNQNEKINISEFKTECKYISNFIENLNFSTYETYVKIRWDPICDNTLNFELKCAEDNNNAEWCKDSSVRNLREIKSLNKYYELRELSSFSKYNLIIKNEENNIYSTNFTTEPSQQQTAVRNLTVFQRNAESISIRWIPPQINESISYYKRLYYKCDESNNIIIKYTSIANSVDPCEIWPDWLCHTISDTNASACYKIYIRGIYENRDKPGFETNVEINSNKASSPPENIAFNPETLTLCWNHPSFIRGKLNNFEINIYQINTTLITTKFKTMPINYVPEIPKLQYCYTLGASLELSSKYKIGIRTKSESASEFTYLTIVTKPILPEIIGDIKIGIHTNSTQEITIPQITPNTITLNSEIYVQICYKHLNKTVTRTEKFDNLTKCNGLSWIAAKFTVTNKEHVVNIGNLSKYGENSFIDNKPLNQTTPYDIHLILINEYEGQESFKVYTANINYSDENISNWNPLYLLLILLLILPIIAFIIYRKVVQKQFVLPPFTGFMGRNDNSSVLPLNRIEKNEPDNITVSAPLLKIKKSETNFNRNSNNFSRVVKLENLSEYVKKSLENGELERQHQLFKKGATKPWEYGNLKENKFKNRYNNLTAYDHSRVILNRMNNDSFSDFINANYIDGYNQKNAYIATQGPKPNTLNDFWRMIWQENVKYIVMLANLTEGGKKKCEKYWPQIGVTQDYVDVSVTFLKSDIFANFEYRTFEVKNGNEKRMIQHFHFTSWPDHGVPLYPQSLVPFLKKINAVPVHQAPIVVHCSAGVGRTGTIILTDICLRMAAAEGQIDALKYLHLIRENRANMVDNFNQYKLVHMVLLEYLLAPETNIPCDEKMSAIIEDLIKSKKYLKQLEYLENTAWHNKAMITKTVMNPENIPKNRFPLIIPNSARIYISRYPYNDDNSDYINAVPVDGFLIKDQFIVTQNPLPNTLKDFWRMVNEYDSKVIVSLNDFQPNDEKCSIFWPQNNEEIKPMPHLIIKHKSETNFDYYDVIKLQITNLNAEEGNETSSIKIIHFKNWNQSFHLPKNPKSLIGVYEEAHNSSRDGKPMIVTCFDGTTASGVFVALSFVIEKIKLEQLCDVSLATRVVRCNREQFIINWDQFIFLHEAASEYVNSFEEYANFQGPSIKNIE